MLNLKEIHQDFTEELQRQWENLGFDYEEVKYLVQTWGQKFDPNDYNFFNWLVKISNIKDEGGEKNEESLRVDYQKYLEKKVQELQEKLGELEEKLTKWGESWEEIKKEYLKSEKKLRQIRLDKLKSIIEKRISKKQRDMLEILLKTQEEVVKNSSNNFAQQQLKNLKEKFKTMANNQSIEDLCRAQIELINIGSRDLSPSDIVKKILQPNENYSSLVERHENSKKTLFFLLPRKSKSEEIKNREIININYELEKANKEEVDPDIIIEKKISNPSDADTKQTVKYVYKRSKARTWNDSFGLEIGANVSAKIGIPTLIDGAIVLSAKANYVHQWGSSESEENTIESTCEINVPATSSGKIIVAAKRIKMIVPFKYTEFITYLDGRTEEITETGTYESIESHDIKVDLETKKIIFEQQSQIPPK